MPLRWALGSQGLAPKLDGVARHCQQLLGHGPRGQGCVSSQTNVVRGEAVELRAEVKRGPIMNRLKKCESGFALDQVLTKVISVKGMAPLSQANRCPPSAAVRQATIARQALACGVLNQLTCAVCHVGPSVRFVQIRPLQPWRTGTQACKLPGVQEARRQPLRQHPNLDASVPQLGRKAKSHPKVASCCTRLERRPQYPFGILCL